MGVRDLRRSGQKWRVVGRDAGRNAEGERGAAHGVPDRIGCVKHVPWHRYKDQEDADGDVGREGGAEATRGQDRGTHAAGTFVSPSRSGRTARHTGRGNALAARAVFGDLGGNRTPRSIV